MSSAISMTSKYMLTGCPITSMGSHGTGIYWISIRVLSHTYFFGCNSVQSHLAGANLELYATC